MVAICVAGLPTAGGREPVWQLEQVAVVSLWLKVAGVQPVGLWQSSQTLLVEKCVPLLPVAVVPLWQLEQLAVMPVWLNVAGVHAVLLWQLLHSAVVAIWVAGLPTAGGREPVWQLEQVAVVLA